MLHIRSAQVEDNDDLQPIMQQCSPAHLVNQYGITDNKLCIIGHTGMYLTGDYFIAELIESQDEAHQTVVAEVRRIYFI